jgi:hypothetical protein
MLRDRAVATSTEVLTSQMCGHASLTSPELRVWSERLRPLWDPDSTDPKPLVMHRKMWEWLFIAAALHERGKLEPESRGLGFGVGREPLVALFAAQGCEIVATDLGSDAAASAGWTASGGEYAGGLTALNEQGLCEASAFGRLVRFREVDMRQIPDDLRNFDFTWSSCALEHLGTLAAGMEFVERQMACLRPGGVAVHTTELNVSSDDRTVSDGATVLYRRRDIRSLARRLRRQGYRVDVDLSEGQTPVDRHIDVPPFTDTHLRTALAGFTTTSFALIVECPSAEARSRRRWWSNQ